MILLDTNVVSEPMRADGDVAVEAWLDRQIADTLFLASTSLAELLFGIAILPAGRRRSGLDVAMSDMIASLFGPRVLPFDRGAAHEYATLVSRARAAGYMISVPDGQIAAIAAAHGLTVATRDTAPFIAAGVPVLCPRELGT